MPRGAVHSQNKKNVMDMNEKPFEELGKAKRTTAFRFHRLMYELRDFELFQIAEELLKMAVFHFKSIRGGVYE